jgi:hypothetical protein
MKPFQVDIDKFLDDPTICSRLIRFEEINEDSIQVLFRDPNDQVLTQQELRSLPFVNDYQYVFRTILWRYRMQKRNAFLLWESLLELYQEKIVNAYDLRLNTDVIFFFVWMIQEGKITKSHQKVVQSFSELEEDDQKRFLREYNATL